jgi:PEP-CTERM motif
MIAMQIRAMARMATLAVALALTGMADPASAGFMDNFNSENNGNSALNYTGFANFTVTAGSVDLIGNNSFDFYPGNGLYVDLNGSTNVSGTLATDSSFGPGLYTLSFSIGNTQIGGATNTMTVSLGNYQETFVRTGLGTLDTITRTIDLTSSAQLVFATPASDSDDGGIIIDNVSLNPTAAVPEPSSFALCGIAGVMGLVVSRVRRKRAAG